MRAWTELMQKSQKINSYRDSYKDISSPQKKWKDVVKQRIARLLTEAYSQGGVLTQIDVAVLLSISRKTVTRYIAEYERETGISLPYRGKIHDIGPAMTHKAEIVELMVKGSNRSTHIYQNSSAFCGTLFLDFR